MRAALDRAAFLPSPLSGAALEVRDIESREEWRAAHAMTVPVLTVVPGSSAAWEEWAVVRPAPRAPAERVGAALEAALVSAAAAGRGGGGA